MEPMFTPRTRSQLPAVDEVSTETLPPHFREKLQASLKSRQDGFEADGQVAGRDYDDDLSDIDEEAGLDGINLEAPSATSKRKSGSFSWRKQTEDGRSATSRSSISSRISQLGQFLKPSCLNPRIVGDQSVWDFEAESLCELIGTLRAGSSFKVVQRKGQPSLQLLDPTESVLMTSYRKEAAPSLLETPMEIVYKNNAYQASMKVPISALRLLNEASQVCAVLWIDVFCINIADALQARFKSLCDLAQRKAKMAEWAAQGFNTCESLRQVLRDSMHRLYCQHKTFIGPSVFEDELFLLQASTLQETLYNDIVLKVDQATEEVEADLAIVTDTRKKGGALNSTASAILRRRAALGTAEDVTVSNGYVHIKGSLSPDSVARLMALLRRVYWRLNLAAESERDATLFQVLREKGLITPSDVDKLRNSLPLPTQVNLTSGTPRVHKRWVSLGPYAATDVKGRRSGALRDLKQPGKNRDKTTGKLLDHSAEANLKRMAAGPEDFKACGLERLNTDLRVGREGLRAYRAQMAVHAPACAVQVELSQWPDRKLSSVVHRRVCVLDGDGVQVCQTESTVDAPKRKEGEDSNKPPQIAGWTTVFLGQEHKVGDTYLFWVSWGGEGGKEEVGEESIAASKAVAIHIAGDMEEDFRELSLSQASTP